MSDLEVNELLREYYGQIDSIISRSSLPDERKEALKARKNWLKTYIWECKKHRQQLNFDKIENMIKFGREV